MQCTKGAKMEKNTFSCSGFWNDDKKPFSGMIVANYSWNGLEDFEDERIFFYTDGFPVIGNHGEFTITEIEGENYED
jgi:hypothetical protein